MNVKLGIYLGTWTYIHSTGIGLGFSCVPHERGTGFLVTWWTFGAVYYPAEFRKGNLIEHSPQGAYNRIFNKQRAGYKHVQSLSYKYWTEQCHLEFDDFTNRLPNDTTILNTVSNSALLDWLDKRLKK